MGQEFKKYEEFVEKTNESNGDGGIEETIGRKMAESVIMALDEIGGFDSVPQNIIDRMVDRSAKDIMNMDHPNIDQNKVKKAFAKNLQDLS